MQNRFKSKVLWASIVAQIVTLLLTLGFIDTGLGAQVNGVVAVALQLLVAVGVLNDPTSANKF